MWWNGTSILLRASFSVWIQSNTFFPACLSVGFLWQVFYLMFKHINNLQFYVYISILIFIFPVKYCNLYAIILCIPKFFCYLLKWLIAQVFLFQFLFWFIKDFPPPSHKSPSQAITMKTCKFCFHNVSLNVFQFKELSIP